MCGIAGYVSTTGFVDASIPEAVQRMTDRMRLRGPDAQAVTAGAGFVFGHRRLAILDLDARSNQPMVTGDGRYSIVFNGEIYNYRELQKELKADGIQFKTTSDTEVLLRLFAREGERMLPRLRGMFAFAIWDAHLRELFIARDPYGIKPLYYKTIDSGFIFASQVKALLASQLFSPIYETAGVAGFYLWGCVPEPWTLYRGVFALPSGSWLRVKDGRHEAPTCWEDIRSNWQQKQADHSVQDLQEHVRQSVTDSVRAHLISDVPVSIFLSAGIDSGTIAGLATQLGAKVEGITIGFDELSASPEDEVPVAAEIAAHYGIPHSIRRITRAEFEQDIPHILDAMDQPSIDGVNTWFASKAASERGYKVVLSGVGGDELFYGYSWMKQFPRNVMLSRTMGIVPGMRALLKAPFNYLANNYAHPKLKGVMEFMGSVEAAYFLKRSLFLPPELPILMGIERALEGLERLGGSPPAMVKADFVNTEAGACMMDSTLYLRNQLLRDSDWTSMQFSLELRTPLVDTTLLSAFKDFNTSFAGGTGKRLLANSPINPLPQRIINRPKSGFGIPMTKWLAAATLRRDWTKMPILAGPKVPWTRRWAKLVMESFIEIEKD
jgi:asparagine synthase (glutamine-hydrolysing)